MQSPNNDTLADPRVRQYPYASYERLRAEDPVHFDKGIQTWLITRHEDIVAAARATEMFSDEMRVSTSIRSPFKAEADEFMRREGFLPLGQTEGFKVDGELHKRRRNLVAPAFSASVVPAMEGRVATICRD